MSHPDSAVMLAILIEVVTNPQASNDMRTKAITQAYELGKIEGHYAGVVHAVSQGSRVSA